MPEHLRKLYACAHCLWASQCACDGPCDDFFPEDEEPWNEAYYYDALTERFEEYEQEVAEYSDGRAEEMV